MNLPDAEKQQVQDELDRVNAGKPLADRGVEQLLTFMPVRGYGH